MYWKQSCHARNRVCSSAQPKKLASGNKGYNVYRRKTTESRIFNQYSYPRYDKNIIKYMMDPNNFFLSTERKKQVWPEKMKQMLKLTDKDFKTGLTIICNELRESILTMNISVEINLSKCNINLNRGSQKQKLQYFK